ncbi:MAG TPA: hypothetical protein VM802_15960 [Chitinophaga sp.]|uniref:hypothetical protein n=1 Tax=Chitinophaga sp. TaxID=1869181 RepID=UPI002CB33312|nr:hypothetical protein [Chitinophaga sp.]HVI46370.1 hypothetical protein [Chitinophaga sp.]
MAKVNVDVKLELGSNYQVVIGIGGNVLHFKESGRQTVDLDPKVYVATIAGFQDPNTESTVAVTFKQGSKVLNSITIEDPKFIKKLFVTVEP